MCVTGQVPGLSLPLEPLEHLEAAPKSRGALWHFPFQLPTFCKRSQGVQGDTPALCCPCAAQMGETELISSCSRDPHCHGHLKPERKPQLHPRGESQGAPTDKLCQSGHKPHTGRCRLPSLAGLQEHWVFLFPGSGVSLSCRDSHHQHSPCWGQRGAAG